MSEYCSKCGTTISEDETSLCAACSTMLKEQTQIKSAVPAALTNALDELKRLQRRNEVLEAREDARREMMMLLRTQPHCPTMGASIDPAYELERFIREYDKDKGQPVGLMVNENPFLRPGVATAPSSSEPYGNSDAREWANQFIRRVTANPTIAHDFDALTSWFASAIMTGHDTAQIAKTDCVGGSASAPFPPHES